MFLFSDISNLGSFGLQNGPNLRAKWALLVIKMGQIEVQNDSFWKG